MMINQMMVALELGPSDERVLDYLDFFTTEIPTGSAYFLHVLPELDLFHTQQEAGAIGVYQFNEEVVNRMQEKIRERLTKHNAVHVQFDLRRGDPLEELLKDSKELQPQLIVVGQRSGTSHHGIMARNLARKVAASALVVPDQSKVEMKHILVPIDFSKHAVQALRTAIAIRKQFGQEVQITALHVYEMPDFNVYRIQKSREEMSQMLKEDRQRAFRTFLDNYAAEEEGQIQTAVVERDMPGIAPYILDYAHEHDASLIVMGAKGHSQVDRLLMGSVTEKMLNQNEDIPTWIVKIPEE